MADAWNRIDEEAAAWVVRLRDASSADWEAFTAWLEADPAHGAAYDLVALADLELDDLPRARPAPLVAIPERRPSRRAFLGWGGAAIAAALVGVVTFGPGGNGDTYAVVTGAGEHRAIALADGSRIELNGGTRLTLDRDNPRFARVEQGEALFTVVHDEARPFQVEAGEARLHDLGTVFNVVHDGARTDVAVAEGAVRWRRGGEQVDLNPGMSLSQREGEGRFGDAWGGGGCRRLAAGTAPVIPARYDAVAADLSRNLGKPVSVAPAAAPRRFSGTIVIDRDAAATMERVGALLDVSARRSGDGWTLAGRLVRAANLLLATTVLISATAAEASGRRDFNLPGGRLGDALVALGQQAGISVGVTDPALAARRVAPVRGRMSVDQALARLLQESGARALAVDSRTWRIVPAPRPRLASAVRRPVPRPAAPLQMPEEAIQPDIVVTASKRAFRLSAFPGAVSFADAEAPAVAAYGRGTKGGGHRLPGLNSTHLGSGRNKLFIRGIADLSFNGPTQATVGQYLGETRLNYNTPDPNLRLYDISRIEILPGPQGTLYGAGSLGGILRIMPNTPRMGVVEGGATASLSVTEHGDPGGELAGTLNLPVAGDTVALRVVGYGVREGGYIDDTRRGLDDVNRTNTYGGRARLRFQADGWTIDLGGAGQRIRGRDGQFADREGPPLTRASPFAENYANDYVLGDIVVRRDWGEGMSFLSTAGIVRQTLTERYDSSRPDEAPTAYDQSNALTFLTAESRLSRLLPDGTGWLIGTSFISNRSELTRALGDPADPAPITGVRNAVDELTAFGEATIGLTEGLTATAGGRITHSRLSGGVLDAPVESIAMLARVSAHRTETAFLPSFALAWRAQRDLVLFARYQEGFRPGGLVVTSPFIARLENGLVVTTPLATPPSFMTVSRFENDHVAMLEAGLRYGRPGAGAFDIAASFAYTRWTDIQADIIDLFGFQTTANIGDGRIFTVDLRAAWRPVERLNLEAAAVFNDSVVTNPEPSIVIAPRAPLPNVARVNLYLGADYGMDIAPDLALRFWGSARYAGPSRLGIGPILGEKQGDWLDIGVGARLEHGRHAFSLSVTNLTDEIGNRFAMGSPFTLALRREITPLRPRTVRIGWDVRF